MSGTSLDGISAAVARFSDSTDGRIDVHLLAYTSRSYSPAQRSRLSAALGGGTPAEDCRLDFDLGRGRADASAEKDTSASAAQLTAESVGRAYRRFSPEPISEVLVSGGGAKNP